jgi:4-amino-4-deoxy-L-arabinose transferase-like glycosyltransferase
MYAAIAATGWLFGGVNEWTARLPSAISASLVVFLFYWYVRRQVGRLGGLIAAAVTPCTYLWLDKGAAAEIDMLQVAWVSAALLLFFRATEEDKKGRASSFGWWLLALLCVAGGVLTKWTAPVFFYAAAIPFLLWRRQFRLLFSWPHLLAAGIGAGLCFAWVGAVIYQVGWDTFYLTVKTEALPRISHQHHLGDTTKQLLETLQHPFKLLLVNLPWTGFALVTLLPSFMLSWDERGRRLVQAFHCWAWPNLLVWTILPDHATRHSFPLFPGITALAAMAWIAFLQRQLSPGQARWMGGFAVLSLAVFGMAALGSGAAAFTVLPAQVWWLVLAIVGMALWCVREGWQAYRGGRLGGLLTSIVVTWIVLKIAFVHIYVPIRNSGREPRAKGALLARHVPPGETLHVFRLKDEGIMFYSGRPVLRLATWDQLPAEKKPVYCILQQEELEQLQRKRHWRTTLEVPLVDEQGDPIVLLGLQRGEPPILQARLGEW